MPPGTWLPRAGMASPTVTLTRVCSPGFAASPHLPPGSSQAKVTSGEPRWKWLWGARQRDRLEEVNNSHTGQSRSERQPQLTVVKHLLCQALS